MAPVSGTGRVEADRIASGTEIFRAAAVETEMLLEAAREDTTDRALATAAAAAPPAWGLEEGAEALVVEAAEGAAGECLDLE
jgi:hypothetical protein